MHRRWIKSKLRYPLTYIPLQRAREHASARNRCRTYQIRNAVLTPICEPSSSPSRNSNHLNHWHPRSHAPRTCQIPLFIHATFAMAREANGEMRPSLFVSTEHRYVSRYAETAGTVQVVPGVPAPPCYFLRGKLSRGAVLWMHLPRAAGPEHYPG